MHVERSCVRTADGWTLELHRGTRPGKPPGAPVVFVPGFGMNSFIFRYHPRGGSFMESLLDRGFDPWSVDLRGQSSARPRKGAPLAISLADFAYTDLPAAFDHIAQVTGHARVHAVGCSLGGALLYAYGGVVPEHRIDRLVTMGTPLIWNRMSWVVNAFATFAPVLRNIPVRGSRTMARFALPVAAKALPGLLGIYLNPAITHTGPVRELVRTVEDPHPHVNRQLAKWIRAKDLVIGGMDVTDALATFDRPLMVIAGNADRICPPENALAAAEIAKGAVRTLVVGDEQHAVAHADLFISDIAFDRVYSPVADFLESA